MTLGTFTSKLCSPLYTCIIHFLYRVWPKRHLQTATTYKYTIQRETNISKIQLKIPKDEIGQAWVGCPAPDQSTVATIGKRCVIETCTLPSSNQL